MQGPSIPPQCFGVGDALTPYFEKIVPRRELRGNIENILSCYRTFLWLLQRIGREAITSSLSRAPTRKMSGEILRWVFGIAKRN
jgi:hypothetical protein